MNDHLDSSIYVTGLFRNLYTAHSALFVRVSTDTNSVFHPQESTDDDDDVIENEESEEN